MSHTRERILETLSQQGPLSVQAIARCTHLSEMATRYHLGLLGQERLVVRMDGESQGRVGRPEGLYALANNAFARLPQPYARVVECLSRELESGLGQKAARTLAVRIGKRIAASAPPIREGAGMQGRLNRAALFLTQIGYAAAVEKDGDFVKLILRHCPYHEMAGSHGHICAMDGAIVEALLGTPFSASDSIGRRETRCQFVVHSRN